MRSQLGRDELEAIEEATGFRVETIEIAARLLGVLSFIAVDPFLRSRVALKGGTAINLFAPSAPRLTVDLDLNHIGSSDAEEARLEQATVHAHLIEACRSAGVRGSTPRQTHALWSFTGHYLDHAGRRKNLKVELNHQHRLPLWPTTLRDAMPLPGLIARGIPVVDVHELCGGKVVALLDRAAARDMFDVPRVLSLASVDMDRARKAVVVLSLGTRDLDLRQATSAPPRIQARAVKDELRPFLHLRSVADDDGWGRFCAELLAECEAALGRLLPIREDEFEFLDRLLDHGEIVPELLDIDDEFRERVRNHPVVRFRAANVKRHRSR